MLKAFLFVAALTGSIHAGTIEPQLLEKLKHDSYANILISMKSGVEPAIARSVMNVGTRAERLNSLRTNLIAHAEESQKDVKILLESHVESVDTIQSYWASNMMYVPKATLELVEKLASMDSIESIIEEKIILWDK